MWLKNGRHSTHTENRNAWHGVHLVLLFVLILLVSHTFGEITFPSERDDLVVKDSNRLLSPDFLPFLNECNTPDADLELCTMYYDTVYNIYQFKPNADEIKAEILAASQKLDTMTDSFCELFPGEVSVAIDQHPFSSINNINITWIQRKSVCTLRCMQLIPPAAVEIKPVCKFISGGCKWITKRKHTSEPIDTNGSLGANPIAKPAEPINREPKVNKVIDINPGAELNQIINPNANPIANVKIDETQNAGPNVNEALNNKPSINVTVTKIASIPIQSGKQTGETITRMDTKQAPNSPPIEPKKSMVTPTLNKSSQSPSTVVISKPSKAKETIPAPVPVQPETEDKPININPNDNNMPASNPNDADKNYNDPNFDDDAKPEDDTEQGNDAGDDDDADEVHEREHEVRNDLKSSNNMQSSLLADTADFREDKESSFFPYFMFLMFVIVTFYVAYHNKSKILALLIEGRRSRTYSSRGSRRKQHSAEYRKLDSNLEEAIQSDGSHMTTSQIIY